jgi:hypothetical protein
MEGVRSSRRRGTGIRARSSRPSGSVWSASESLFAAEEGGNSNPGLEER